MWGVQVGLSVPGLPSPALPVIGNGSFPLPCPGSGTQGDGSAVARGMLLTHTPGLATLPRPTGSPLWPCANSNLHHYRPLPPAQLLPLLRPFQRSSQRSQPKPKPHHSTSLSKTSVVFVLLGVKASSYIALPHPVVFSPMSPT